MVELVNITEYNFTSWSAGRFICVVVVSVGLVGTAVGIGILFGLLLKAYSRNLQFQEEIFLYVILGFMLTEVMGWFDLILALSGGFGNRFVLLMIRESDMVFTCLDKKNTVFLNKKNSVFLKKKNSVFLNFNRKYSTYDYTSGVDLIRKYPWTKWNNSFLHPRLVEMFLIDNENWLKCEQFSVFGRVNFGRRVMYSPLEMKAILSSEKNLITILDFLITQIKNDIESYSYNSVYYRYKLIRDVTCYSLLEKVHLLRLLWLYSDQQIFVKYNESTDLFCVFWVSDKVIKSIESYSDEVYVKSKYLPSWLVRYFIKDDKSGSKFLSYIRNIHSNPNKSEYAVKEIKTIIARGTPNGITKLFRILINSQLDTEYKQDLDMVNIEEPWENYILIKSVWLDLYNTDSSEDLCNEFRLTKGEIEEWLLGSLSFTSALEMSRNASVKIFPKLSEGEIVKKLDLEKEFRDKLINLKSFELRYDRYYYC